MYVDIFNTSKKYQIIYADPPWKYRSRKYQDGNRAFEKLEENHYSTMTIYELSKLPSQ